GVLLPSCHWGPAGVKEHGERPPGFPSNRRDLPLSLALSIGSGVAEPENPRPPWPRRALAERRATQRGYRRASTRVRGDGVAGVGVLHSTVEVGELGPRGPGGGKGGPGHGPVVGPQGQDTDPRLPVHETAGDSTVGREAVT